MRTKYLKKIKYGDIYYSLLNNFKDSSFNFSNT